MKKALLFIGVVGLAVFASCKRDDNPSAAGSMSFSAAFEESSAGKAARNNAFAAGDNIGIFVVPYASMSPEKRGVLFGKGNYADNVPFVTVNGTAFAPVAGNTIAYPNAQTKVDIYAFGLFNAVYQDLGSDPTKFAWTVDAVQTDDAKILRNDLMSAATLGVTPSTSAIGLTFKHRLAKADATVTVPTTFRGANVTGSTLFIDGTRLKATVDMTNPAEPATVVATDNPIAAIQSFKTSGAASGACTFQAIVLPCTIAANELSARLVLTLADNSSVTLNCRSTKDVVYETGKQTLLQFTVEDEYTLKLGTVSITGWTTKDAVPVDARRPARLIFGTNGEAAKAESVVFADLSIDDTTYTKVSVAYNATAKTLTCTYLQPTTRTDGYLKGITLKDKDGTKVETIAFFPSFHGNEGGSLHIPKNPGNTDPSYNKITSTVTF